MRRQEQAAVREPALCAAAVAVVVKQRDERRAAREIDQQYEWSAHEPAGLRQGLEQSVIDVVKYDRPVAGLAEKDATLITFGRTPLRDNKASSEVWADMVRLFGRQHTIDLLGIMGDYLRVGIMLNAVNQQQPPSRPALLTPLDRE